VGGQCTCASTDALSCAAWFITWFACCAAPCHSSRTVRSASKRAVEVKSDTCQSVSGCGRDTWQCALCAQPRIAPRPPWRPCALWPAAFAAPPPAAAAPPRSPRASASGVLEDRDMAGEMATWVHSAPQQMNVPSPAAAASGAAPSTRAAPPRAPVAEEVSLWSSMGTTRGSEQLSVGTLATASSPRATRAAAPRAPARPPAPPPWRALGATLKTIAPS